MNKKENNTAKGTSPKTDMLVEDIKKKIDKRKLKKKIKLSNYWDEPLMQLLYKKLLDKKASKKEERLFWNTISTLIEKVYFSYSSIQKFYIRYDDPTEEVKAAQLLIVGEIFRALFQTRLYSQEKGKLFSFVTVITRNWYIYYLNNRYKEISKFRQYTSQLIEKLKNIPTYDEDVLFEKELQEMTLLFNFYKKELEAIFTQEPYITSVILFFKLLHTDLNKPYVKYQRNFFNYMSRKIIKKRHTTYYNEAINYLARYLKKNLHSNFKNKYSLETMEDFIKVSKKILERMKELYDGYSKVKTPH